MPGAPPLETLNTPELRNRWGVMRREERLSYMTEWWTSLPKTLPVPEWRTAWATCVAPVPNLQNGRRLLTGWLYKAEKAICAELKNGIPAHDSFNGLCTELNAFSSNCGKSRPRAKTCRAAKTKRRTSLKRKRRDAYILTGGFL